MVDTKGENSRALPILKIDHWRTTCGPNMTKGRKGKCVVSQ